MVTTWLHILGDWHAWNLFYIRRNKFWSHHLNWHRLHLCTDSRIFVSDFFQRNNSNLIFAHINDMIGSLNGCVLIGRFWNAFHSVMIGLIIRVALTAIIIGCGDAITIFTILFLWNSQIIFDRFAEISWNTLKYHFSFLDLSWWPWIRVQWRKMTS